MADKSYRSRLDSSVHILMVFFFIAIIVTVTLLVVLKHRMLLNIDGNTIVAIAITTIVLITAYYCFNRFRYTSINGLHLKTYICLVPIDSIPIGTIDKISNRKSARLKHGQHHFNYSSPPGYLSIQGRFEEQEIIVSVLDKNEFIEHLLSINPNITIDI